MTIMTDIFVKRPVLATVISLFILVLGLRAVFLLQVLQYPKTESTVIKVQTAYPGASAETIEGFVTSLLEKVISQTDGIDHITSTSTQGSSVIKIHLKMNYDSSSALTEIMSKISSVKNQMPPDALNPIVTLSKGHTISALYITFRNDALQPNQTTDYVIRTVEPQLQAIDGVQGLTYYGEKIFAMRIFLDPLKLAAYHITPSDVRQSLRENDYLSSPGKTKGQYITLNLKATTNLSTVRQFKRMVIKSNPKTGAFVRLEDIGRVVLGSETYDYASRVNGATGVTLGINVAPTANLLSVANRVRKAFPGIKAAMPHGMTSYIVYDSTTFVSNSITEVIETLAEALAIVTLVIFLFMGSLRAVIIPVFAIPLSLIGAFFFMLVLGFSINLLTLLALVLAIGLVVDDAIIVVENVSRHIEEGIDPFRAALVAARELMNPIFAMTIVLIAVYIPIGFMSGLTGTLFSEFAFTLVAAVTVSAIVALVLSPVMCSKTLKPHHDLHGFERVFVDKIEKYFYRLGQWYKKCLHNSLNTMYLTVILACVVFTSIFFFYHFSQKSLAPKEDQGIIIDFTIPPTTATLDQNKIYMDEAYNIFTSYPEVAKTFQMIAPGEIMSGAVLKPWNERVKSASELQKEMQGRFANMSGVQSVVFQPPSLPGSGGGMPIQFVVQTTDSFLRLNEVMKNFSKEVDKAGLFIFYQNDLKYSTPQIILDIDKEKASELGFNMQTIGGNLSSLLNGGYVNFFNYDGRAYKVIAQVARKFRLNPYQILNTYINTPEGYSVPLSTFMTIKVKTVPASLNRFQQMNSATLSGVAMPGLSMGTILEGLQKIAKKTLPSAYKINYGGEARQFINESGALTTTFLFSLLIVFLTLAAQFESFRDPFIILISVPMSICGALFFISLGIGGASLNIYTQVGLITLIGLISKHGILIVDFANKLQEKGYSKRNAIEEASAIRFRPILMTTAAMVLGVVPLLFASGAGAASRFQIGLVITTGLLIGTCFTLFVVPTFYLLLGHEKKPNTLDKAIALDNLGSNFEKTDVKK